MANEKFLTVSFTIRLDEGVDADQAKYLIEHYGTNIPWDGFPVHHGVMTLGRVTTDCGQVIVWPKETM